MKRGNYAVGLICSLLMLTALVSAQVATGTPRFNSFGGGPFDTVNLGNLNVDFAIPIIQKAGRGLPFSYALDYDGSIWTPVTTNGSQSWKPSSTWGWQNGTAQTVAPFVQYTLTTGGGACGYMGFGSYTTYTYSNFVYHDQFGGKHPFNVTAEYVQLGLNAAGCPATGSYPNYSQTASAQDGSNYTITVGIAPGVVGSLVNCNGQTITAAWVNTPPTQSSNYSLVDANGNTISYNASTGQYTDTLNKTVLTISGSNPLSFTYTSPSGPVSYQVNYTTKNVKTHFNCSNIAEYTANNVSLVSSISLPDGTSYSFNYEATPGFSGYVTGRLASVTLPTGGSITYAYSGGSNGIVCADGSTAGLSRTLSPGGAWTYTRNQVSGNHWQTTVATPPDSQNTGSASDETVIDFMEDSATGAAATYSFYETQRQSYQGTHTGGTLLLTTKSCWNGNTASCTTTGVSSPITQSSVTLQYPGGGLQSQTNTFYNACGSVNESDQYAYGTGSPGSLLRKTTISYASLGNNIVDHPSAITVTDGTHTLSNTTYAYDETAYPLNTSLTGTPQHQSVTGSRGNATTITSTVIGTTTLSRHFSYYDTGNVYQAYDVNGATTTYNYSNATATCGNTFSSSVTLPISVGGTALSTSNTWDCNGGVALTGTDLNGNTVTTAYSDPYFWRPASVTAPYAGASTTTTNFTYTHYTTSALAHTESTMTFNGGASVVDALNTSGKFGQPLYSQQREGPSSSSWDSTQVLYDSFLRAYQSSMPCVVTSSTAPTYTDQNQACSSSPATTTVFDAPLVQTTDGGGGWIKSTHTQNDVLQEIGPAPSGESTKKKQLEYDALGRLTSVCEISSGLPGSGTCSQNSSQPSGYYTTYAYSVNGSGDLVTTVTQNAQAASGHQTRTYTYDLLGRLLSEVNPENGTTAYTYDSDSVGDCSGTYSGDLVKVVDAKGNKICYTYDAMHRLLTITYPSSGPDAGNTPSKTFVYDSATFNGTAMANPKGRMAEAYTGSSGSKTTDEFFQYSVRGEVTDTWECTPHSGTSGCASVSNYYKVTAAFWENGALETLSSSISGLPTQTYGVDTMGRTNAVSASAGQNPVTSTAYDLAVNDTSHYTTTITYGSTDSDVLKTDLNTGRMTSYKFNVGSQNVTGNLTWNANGSLSMLAITNALNSLDTQTCSYTHDDISRISSVGCVNGSTNRWNQQFTYDAFGNITKTVPVGGTGTNFQPTYSSSTNQITSLPSCTPTTDSNGQMTYDCTHNYTWDAEGKMHSVDASPSSCSTSGVCLTYDALGRMVEKTVGSTYTQIVYGPQGRFATMNGQTFVKAFIPLPGAQAVYTSASLNTSNKVAYYRHSDHLGSSRLATTPTQTLYSSTAYAPFGEPYSQSGTTDLSFTGQEQDTVTGMHDFLDRKYPTVQGRWLSPDPMGLAAVNPGNPQSWNRYAYVLNNPMTLVDPFGDDCQYTFHTGWTGTDCAASSGFGANNSAPPPGTMPGQQVGYNPGGILNQNNSPGWTPIFGAGNEFDRLEYQLAVGVFDPSDPFNQPGWHTECEEVEGVTDEVCTPYWIPDDNSGPDPGFFGAGGGLFSALPPCDKAGGAPDPSFYQAKGQAASRSPFGDFSVFQWGDSGNLNPQRMGAKPSYANYVYGVYMSAAGFTLDQALTGADLFAGRYRSYSPGTTMDPTYQSTPAVNVVNIKRGFAAQQTGTLCHK